MGAAATRWKARKARTSSSNSNSLIANEAVAEEKQNEQKTSHVSAASYEQTWKDQSQLPGFSPTQGKKKMSLKSENMEIESQTEQSKSSLAPEFEGDISYWELCRDTCTCRL